MFFFCASEASERAERMGLAFDRARARGTRSARPVRGCQQAHCVRTSRRKARAPAIPGAASQGLGVGAGATGMGLACAAGVTSANATRARPARDRIKLLLPHLAVRQRREARGEHRHGAGGERAKGVAAASSFEERARLFSISITRLLQRRDERLLVIN